MFPIVAYEDVLILHFVKNSELFTLTYGSIVHRLVKNLETIHEVNVQLEKMQVLIRSSSSIL